MDDTGNIYFSLDAARAELARRWADVELRRRVEAELGTRFVPKFRARPRAVITRQLLSPDNGFIFFHQAANYVGGEPFAWEFFGDFFSRCNDEKRGWGELRVVDVDRKLLIEVISMSGSNRKPFLEVVTRLGEPLVAFHGRLLGLAGYPIEQQDMTQWFHEIGKPTEYYYPWMLHMVAHGVLFDNFQTTADPKEAPFTHNVVLPALQRIEEKFGLRPLVVRLYPEHQTPEEDFYWWSYPPQINEHLVNYAKVHKLPMRPALLRET